MQSASIKIEEKIGGKFRLARLVGISGITAITVPKSESYETTAKNLLIEFKDQIGNRRAWVTTELGGVIITNYS